MMLTKLKMVATLVLVAALAGAGVGMYRQAGARPPIDEPSAATPSNPADPDSDGDGLPDFQEIHKYRTDPGKKDTAGRGIADGDWQERREFTYTVRAVLRLMPAYNLKDMNDDYQDVRVLAETKDYFPVPLDRILSDGRRRTGQSRKALDTWPRRPCLGHTSPESSKGVPLLLHKLLMLND